MTSKLSLFESYKKYAVQAESLEDFLERYTQPRAHAERGEEYVQARIEAHREDIEKHGFTFITRHDSTYGRDVSYYPEA